MAVHTRYDQTTNVRHNILFLLRTYNDFDHITPIIWKTAVLGWKAQFLFVDKCYLEDYRIRFLVKAGALHLRCKPIEWYHHKLRRWLGPLFIQKITDRVIAYTLGSYFLRRNRIQIVANEWSGAFGREMADYFLRAAKKNRLRSISLPHGYYIWKNMEINRFEVDLWNRKRKRPDFSDRNIFSAYVVQNEEAICFLVDRGMQKEKIFNLGSARFCPEWLAINFDLILKDKESVRDLSEFVVLFFVPDWEYNIDRVACLTLIRKLAALNGVSLIVKANTRGTGSLNKDEIGYFRSKINVSFPEVRQHSTVLIDQADVIVNFASSIGLEAILQEKPVCNPLYLNGNTTIFDGSGVVFDAQDDDDVINFIRIVQNGDRDPVSRSILDTFIGKYIFGGIEQSDVLNNYLCLLSEDE
jgi:hypothetical protein